MVSFFKGYRCAQDSYIRCVEDLQELLTCLFEVVSGECPASWDAEEDLLRQIQSKSSELEALGSKFTGLRRELGEIFKTEENIARFLNWEE